MPLNSHAKNYYLLGGWIVGSQKVNQIQQYSFGNLNNYLLDHMLVAKWLKGTECMRNANIDWGAHSLILIIETS